ncbi:hypothetical protein AGR7B_Lc70009 [Agrobacterium deltaense RV3]|nr:hypothetical protein AGR7B_Lc70009 [Agrobacterium deltaense RV3]
MVHDVSIDFADVPTVPEKVDGINQSSCVCLLATVDQCSAASICIDRAPAHVFDIDPHAVTGGQLAQRDEVADQTFVVTIVATSTQALGSDIGRSRNDVFDRGRVKIRPENKEFDIEDFHAFAVEYGPKF